MTLYRLPRELDVIEQRVVGCLLEKELATPDAYPLSLKALTAAANQKSNRDPVTAFDEGEVEAALQRLLPEVLVWRVRSSRVLRWQHNLEGKWDLDPAGRAVLAELLLRGPQTPGELRTRGARMADLPDLETVHAVLEQLASQELVLELVRQPGQKEARWAHRLAALPDEASQAPSVDMVMAVGEPAATGAGVLDRLERLERRLERVARDLDEVRRELGLAPAPESEDEHEEVGA